MRARATVLAGCLCLAGPGLAQDGPISAIDWLSDSIAEPDNTALTAPRALSERPGPILVTPLEAPDADAAGLLSPSVTGLPRALWGPATEADVIALMLATPRTLPPELLRLYKTLLLAEADAPVASDGKDAFLLARVDRLLSMGALDQAGALLERAGLDTPDRFRRYFDVALLQGREQSACQLLRTRPEISPTYPARIFCLARNGDWAAAALTLDTATSLGILTPDEDLLLARFLDPHIIEAPDPGMPVTPLTFRIWEAVGEPRATATLPIAFAWADLRATRGWKAQIAAAERLARVGALSANQLFGLYLAQRPSASGGLWERATAVQDLDQAIATGDPEAVAKSLPPAWKSLKAAGLHHALAAQYGADLAAMKLGGEPGRIALTLGLISPSYEEVAIGAEAPDPAMRFLLALARGTPETAVATDLLAAQVREGFLADKAPEAFDRYLREGRVGEAILKAINLFSEGASGEVDGLSGAIATLRALGLESVARRASLELLLSDGMG